MKVSVVTATLNSERTVAYTIESFLEQTYSAKEMIIIDGASNDRTVEIAKSFRSDAIRIFSERDSGIYDALNKGLRWFGGDAVGFLGSDDTFHDSSALEALAGGLQNFDIVYGDLRVVRDHMRKQVVTTFRPGTYHRRAFQRGWMPPHPTFYVRRHVVDAVGLFDRRYKISADYDFILRAMVLNDFRSCYIPRVLVDFGAGGTSSRGFFRSTLVHSLEGLDVRRRRLGAMPIDLAFFLKPARSLLRLLWRA